MTSRVVAREAMAPVGRSGTARLPRLPGDDGRRALAPDVRGRRVRRAASWRDSRPAARRWLCATVISCAASSPSRSAPSSTSNSGRPRCCHCGRGVGHYRQVERSVETAEAFDLNVQPRW